MMLITFSLIKKFHGLRVSPEEEISGLDSVEHGLASAYAGFEFSLDPTLAEYTVPTAASSVPVDVAVPVTDVSSAKSLCMTLKMLLRSEQAKKDLTLYRVTSSSEHNLYIRRR